MTDYTVVLNIKQREAIETGISVSQGDYGQVGFTIRVKDDDSYIVDAVSAFIVFLTADGRMVEGGLTEMCIRDRGADTLCGPRCYNRRRTCALYRNQS